MDMDTGNTGDTDDAENTPFIDTEDYADWRFGMEEAVMSAREILGDDVLYGPHVAALGGREELESDLAAAREVLGNDDLVLGGYTAAARAEQWEAEWAEYVDRAAGDGLDPRRTEAGLEMIAQGRTITGDPSLPPDRLDGIEAVIADADACHAAVGRYDEWLGEWNLLEEKAAEDGVPVHSLPGAADMIGRARDLADTPSLPGDCREEVRDRIAGHEAHQAAMEMELRNGGWEETRESASAARRKSVAIRRSLAELRARVLDSGSMARYESVFGQVIEGGKELSANPALPGPEGRRLGEAIGKAEAFSRANLRCETWGSVLEEYLETVEMAGYRDRHPYDLKGIGWCVKEARALLGEPDLLPGNLGRVREFLDDYDRAWPEAQRRYSDMAGRWNRFKGDAEREGRNVFESEGCGPLVDRIRELADGPHLTGQQKEKVERIVKGWDAHQKELARSKQKSRGGGFGM